MTTRPFLDRRHMNSDGTYPVKIALRDGGRNAYVPTGISVEERHWDKATGKVTGHPMRARYNLRISECLLEVEKTLERMREEGRMRGIDIYGIRDEVERARREREFGIPRGDTLFLECFREFAETKGTEGTRGVYEGTLRKLEAYEGCDERTVFGDIDPSWLSDFEAWLTETMPSANSSSIHLRNIRALFNYALSEGLTEAPYPFRKFKIRSGPTKDRSIPVETLREFFECPCTEAQARYRDVFRLSFLLCGINIVDLFRLTTIRMGRVEFSRAKTGQPLSIGVPPEAMEIIGKYRGTNHLLVMADKCGNYDNYLHRLNDSLKRIGQTYNPHTKKWEGDAVVPDISYYYARYSWATLVAELDVAERTIGAALGHSTSKTVTSIYTRVDMKKKVDAANRKVHVPD